VDYNVSGNLIWMIEATGTNVFGNISANQWNYYRVLNIKQSEQDEGTYEVEGLEYNINKFEQIDSGFNFGTITSQSYITPAGPSNLQAYSQNVTANSQEIFYSFFPPSSLSGVIGYQTFLKTSPFVAGDTTNLSLIIDNLPISANSGVYVPLSNGTYYIHVYSVGQQNILSTTYAGNDSNPLIISNINPLEDITNRYW
jgi:predicted phage tail protein